MLLETIMFQVEKFVTKGRGSEMEHSRADPRFSCISVDGDILSSFFIPRQIDKESNPSRFIIFGAFMNYL